MIIGEPGQQVVVFNSLAHTSSSILPDQLYVSIVLILTSIETAPKRAALRSCVILFETSLSNCQAGHRTGIGWKPRVYLFHIVSYHSFFLGQVTLPIHFYAFVLPLTRSGTP